MERLIEIVGIQCFDYEIANMPEGLKDRAKFAEGSYSKGDEQEFLVSILISLLDQEN